MQKFFYLIVFLSSILFSCGTFAQENKTVAPNASQDNSIYRQIEKTLRNYATIEQAYPDAKIDTDFFADLEKMYPFLSEAELREKENTFRARIKFYRFLKGKYLEYKEKILLPSTPVLDLPESHYDLQRNYDYVESSSQNPVVIKDFKSVLSYGMNKRDFEAMEAYQKKKFREANFSSHEEIQLIDLLSDLEWGKILFYGLIYDNPFTGKKGIGEWVNLPHVAVRLLSLQSEVNDNHLDFALHVFVKKNYVLLWSEDKQILPPKFDFSKSQNLKNIEPIMPIPQRIVDKTDDNIMGFMNGFAIPIKAEVVDKTKPIVLDAQVDFSVCGNNQCQKENVNPILHLDVGENKINSAVSAFISKAYANLPTPKNKNIKIQKVFVNDDSQPSLIVQFETNTAPEKIQIFLDGKNAHLFKRPKISINGDEVVARFALKDVSKQIVGEKIGVTISINPYDNIRDEFVIEKNSLLDVKTHRLSISLLFMAFIGGFILNFMPCVFPALFLKFSSLIHYGKMSEAQIRKSFAYTSLGIMSAFAFLIVLLMGLKYFGVAIGWGMQFQNPYFIVAVCFIMVLFIAHINSWIDISVPQIVINKFNQKLSKINNEDVLNLCAGFFIVLVATPCTAPYLGTAIGFALAGDYFDIFLILSFVGLGLALPYILLSVYPYLGYFMPKPGMWMAKWNYLMVFLLFLTLCWLMSLLLAQTNWNTIKWVIFSFFVFLFSLYFRKSVLNVIDNQNEDEFVRNRAKNIFKKVILYFMLALAVVCFYKADKAFKMRMAEVALSKEVKIDRAQIDAYLKEGNIVIVRVGADWCLTCKFNDVTVFDNSKIEELAKFYKVKYIDVDWTDYDRKVLEFMRQFGRSGLPFYIIFSRSVPDGMVLPEILTEDELTKVIKGFAD